MSSGRLKRLWGMTEIAAEIRAGVRPGAVGLVAWVERDYPVALERVADALPQAWAPDGRDVTLEPLGRGCVVRVEVAVDDLGEAAAVTDGWCARLAGLAADLDAPGQLALLQVA